MAHDQGECSTIWVESGVYSENLTLNRDVTINGTGSVRITGERRGRTLTVTSGQVTLRDLVVSDGLESSGGCIHNTGSLTLERVEVTGCEASGRSPRGAGIANFGALTLRASKVHDNFAIAAPDSLKVPGEILGGGIYSEGATLTLEGSEISGNLLRALGAEDTMLQGGGIYSGDSTVSIHENSSIHDNRLEVRGAGRFLSGCEGGGIYHAGGTLSLTSSTVKGNVVDAEAGSGDSAEAIGAGIYYGSLSAPEFAGLEISENVAHAKGPNTRAEGAGLSVQSPEAKFTDCKIVDNRAVAEGGENSAVGGGVGAGHGHPVRLAFERSWISGNSVSADQGATGGGIYVQSMNDETRVEVELASSVAEGNRAVGVGAQGGFLYGLVFERSELGVYLGNSTVSGNSADAAGGAVTIHAGLIGLGEETAPRPVDLDVSSATITLNSASQGGAFFVDTSEASAEVHFVLRNSIVAQNQAEQAADCPASAPIDSGGYNLLGGDTCSLVANDALDLVDVDPQLQALSDVQGTRVHVLSPMSPAIDAGDPDGCRDRSGAALTSDQRGAARVVAGRCDIGAYEAP